MLPTPCYTSGTSRPARGAWIEIKVTVKINNQNKVAPRKGRVD